MKIGNNNVVQRRVSAKGNIRIGGETYYLGNGAAGKLVTLSTATNGMMMILGYMDKNPVYGKKPELGKTTQFLRLKTLAEKREEYSRQMKEAAEREAAKAKGE